MIGVHSLSIDKALNMFDEFTMLDPGPLASYVGFTEKEVEMLCVGYGMEMEEVKNWYAEKCGTGRLMAGESIGTIFCYARKITVKNWRKRGFIWMLAYKFCKIKLCFFFCAFCRIIEVD